MANPVQQNSINSLYPETITIHADDELHVSNDVAPPLHVTNTFRFQSDPEALVPLRYRAVSSFTVLTIHLATGFSGKLELTDRP